MHMVNDTNNFGIAGAVRGLTAPYVGISVRRVMWVVVLATTLAGCGLKGGLYLPEKQQPVVVTPAASDGASSAASSSAVSSVSSQ